MEAASGRSLRRARSTLENKGRGTGRHGNRRSRIAGQVMAQVVKRMGAAKVTA